MEKAARHEDMHTEHHVHLEGLGAERRVHLSSADRRAIAEEVKNELKAEFALKVLGLLGVSMVSGLLAVTSAVGTWYTLSGQVARNTDDIGMLKGADDKRLTEINSIKNYMEVRFDALRSVLDARDITLNSKVDEINRFLRDHNRSPHR